VIVTFYIMIKMILAIAITFCMQNLFAQTVIDTSKNLDEVVISSSNFNEKKKNIAQKIEVITAKKIEFANAQSTGDLLMSTGKIFVQKSQQGGSSPVLRGFEASRILLIIDGVRMNNAIYRSGHLQNAITLDQNSLSRVEIMYGAASTIYGSDALGGSVHFITKMPILDSGKKTFTVGNSFARYSSVNNEKTVHIDASIANNKIGWYQAYNFSDFGDLKMGNKYRAAYPNFGRRSFYVGQVNGIDSVLANTDDKVQKFSGYKQWDIVQKFLFKPSYNIAHLINIQFSNTNNVPRYDRLQDIKNFGGSIGTPLRFAEWYYGPQKRFLASYEFTKRNAGFFNEIKTNINFQHIEESRQTREYRRLDRFDSQVEKVKVLGATVAGRKFMGRSELAIGADMQLNNVQSTATRTNLITSVVVPLNTRYPDGKNTMNNIGIYGQHTYKFKNKRLVLNDGIRLQSISLKSNILDNSFFKLPDTAITQNNIAITGNIGVVFTAHKNSIIAANISSGFRAPNIDDLSKIFESSTAAQQVVFPNANIKPEYTYNIDLNLKQKLAANTYIELTGFYTLFRNAIVKAPFALNGNDSILFNGVKSQILANQNLNKANVLGFSFDALATIFKGFTLSTNFTYTKGFFKTDESKTSSIYELQPNGLYAIVNKNVSTKPLDHIPPVMGKTTMAYTYKIFNTEFAIQYNGWKRLNNFNADGEDNAQYAVQGVGMPSWIITNWKGNIELPKKIKIQLGIDNIFDRNYRTFASGFSSGGRNFIIAVRKGW
jgi:hemoglobin/transferrin/lactoferrin receptor protein